MLNPAQHNILCLVSSSILRGVFFFSRKLSLLLFMLLWILSVSPTASFIETDRERKEGKKTSVLLISLLSFLFLLFHSFCLTSSTKVSWESEWKTVAYITTRERGYSEKIMRKKDANDRLSFVFMLSSLHFFGSSSPLFYLYLVLVSFIFAPVAGLPMNLTETKETSEWNRRIKKEETGQEIVLKEETVV